MEKHKISPEKITKPFQLLAAWLIGLIVVNGSFLGTATQISVPEWAPAFLIVVSILNVPIFLFCIFLLQTKFRPEMQEDKYYSEYLSRESSAKTAKETGKKAAENKDLKLQTLAENILYATGATTQSDKVKDKVKEILHNSEVEELEKIYGRSRSLAELYMLPDRWPKLVSSYEGDNSFEQDIWPLVKEGLVDYDGKDMKNMKITELGKEVARLAESKNHLYEVLTE